MYHRSKKKRADGEGQRWWRTRVDPFAGVWAEIGQQLADHPHLPAKTILKELQQTYPDQFQEGQLRTLQRRVKAWRRDHIDDKMNTENPFSIPEIGETG